MLLQVLLMLSATVSAAHPPSASASCGFRPAKLRTNNLVNPLGTPTATPRLSWQLASSTAPAQRGLAQSAYQIKCSSKPGGGADLWDSGKVASAESLQIPYAGKALKSSQTVHWSVSVWDASGTQCADASPEAAWFETALLDEAAWQGAQWLSRYEGLATLIAVLSRPSSNASSPPVPNSFSSLSLPLFLFLAIPPSLLVSF